MQLAPFVGVNNLWDRRYVGSVTLNGLRPGVRAGAAAGGVHRDRDRVSGAVRPRPCESADARQVLHPGGRLAFAYSNDTGSRSITTRVFPALGSLRAA